MDPEQTFLRVHARLSGMLSQLLTPKIRLALEYIYLTVAVALLVLLVVMHTNFVQQLGCSNELSGGELTEAQLVQIKISSSGLWTHNVDDQNVVDFKKQAIPAEDSKIVNVNLAGFTIFTSKFWTNWIGSGARRSKLIFKSWKSEKEIIEPQTENAANIGNSKTSRDGAAIKSERGLLHTHLPVSFKDTSYAAIISFCTNWHKHLSSFWQIVIKSARGVSQSWNTAGWTVFLDFFKISKKLHMGDHDSLIVHWLDKRSKAFEPTYLYTFEKGFFLLPEAAKSRHHIQTVNITISAQNSCFGNRWQQLLINSFVGYDTILMNSLLNSPGKGYLYNFQTNELYYLSYGRESSEGPSRFGDYIATKFGVLIMSLFVFFTTTMSVSFTLRETQSRMLRFTVQLQHHARHQLPTFQLIFVHVIESLVFVPIMIGILFFLFEFYDDQLLAFLVLTLVWLCELFTMISVRTSISMQFFPRFFLLYFLVFHIYFFCYPYGFSYLAFSATAAFMQHIILYFWNRFEVPALQRIMRSRGLQHQAAVQITSSTIYTSTLHIARVNVSDTDPVNGGPGILEEAASDNSDPNPQQTGTAPGPGFLNPFASLLLWIVGGGGTSDGIVSFFSMFRDVREDRDQGQAYEEPLRHEEESTAL